MKYHLVVDDMSNASVALLMTAALQTTATKLDRDRIERRLGVAAIGTRWECDGVAVEVSVCVRQQPAETSEGRA